MEEATPRQASYSSSPANWRWVNFLQYEPSPLLEFIRNPPEYFARVETDKTFPISDMAVASSCMAHVLGFAPKGIFVKEIDYPAGKATSESKQQSIFLGLGCLMCLIKPLTTENPKLDNSRYFVTIWNSLLKTTGFQDQIGSLARARLLKKIIEYQNAIRSNSSEIMAGAGKDKLWKRAVVQQLVVGSGVNCIMKELDLFYNMAQMKSIENMELFINSKNSVFVSKIIEAVRNNTNDFEICWTTFKSMYPKTYMYGRVLGHCGIPEIGQYPDLYYAASRWATQSGRFHEGKMQFSRVKPRTSRDLIEMVVDESRKHS